MKLVVITPEEDFPREHALIAAMFSAGLQRLHVRKPNLSKEALAAWLSEVAAPTRRRLVLHSHHELAGEFGCGGIHFRDAPAAAPAGAFARPDGPRAGTATQVLTSRSCHTMGALVDAFGRYGAVFFSPVFPSISKPGYAPGVSLSELSERLRRRTTAERNTTVIALGGITAINAPRCLALGFDAVAVLGSVWHSTEPLRAFLEIRKEVGEHAG